MGLLRRLSRVTSTGRYIPELDGLRAIAIGWVVLQHIQLTALGGKEPTFGVSLISKGHFGVELFFVISGFILALPFKNAFSEGGRRVRLADYYQRRLTRLEPPYVLHLVIASILLMLGGAQFSDLLPHFLSSLFYVSNFIEGWFNPALINSVTWSLELEVQFYLLAPLFGYVFLVRHHGSRVAAMVAAILFVFATHHVLSGYYKGGLPVSLLEYFQYFGVGFLIADRYRGAPSHPDRSAHIADIVALGAWIAIVAMFQLDPPGQSLITAALLYAAVYSSLTSNRVRKALANVYVRTVGGMCYSIYLLHMPLIKIIIPADHVPLLGYGLFGLFFDTLLYGVPILAVSATFFVLVEKPCMKHGWWRAPWRSAPATI